MKKSGGYVYIIKPPELKGIKPDRFKVGMSNSNNDNRIKSYGKGTVVIAKFHCDSPKEIETLLIKKFKSMFNIIKGNEYFEGNIHEAEKIFYEITTQGSTSNDLINFHKKNSIVIYNKFKICYKKDIKDEEDEDDYDCLNIQDRYDYREDIVLGGRKKLVKLKFDDINGNIMGEFIIHEQLSFNNTEHIVIDGKPQILQFCIHPKDSIEYANVSNCWNYITKKNHLNLRKKSIENNIDHQYQYEYVFDIQILFGLLKNFKQKVSNIIDIDKQLKCNNDPQSIETTLRRLFVTDCVLNKNTLAVSYKKKDNSKYEAITYYIMGEKTDSIVIVKIRNKHYTENTLRKCIPYKIAYRDNKCTIINRQYKKIGIGRLIKPYKNYDDEYLYNDDGAPWGGYDKLIKILKNYKNIIKKGIEVYLNENEVFNEILNKCK